MGQAALAQIQAEAENGSLRRHAQIGYSVAVGERLAHRNVIPRLLQGR